MALLGSEREKFFYSSGGQRRENAKLCRHPRRRVTQYPRDADDRTEKSRRTGSPAFAEDDSGGWSRTTHVIAPPTPPPAPAAPCAAGSSGSVCRCPARNR